MSGIEKKPMSHQLRAELIHYTSKQNITIIEDDYNGELNYASAKQHVLHSMTNTDHVIYCGSFSRLVVPALRISYLVLNEHYYKIYKSFKDQYGPSASKLEQLAFAQYISDGHLTKHIKKLKKDYDQKHLKMHSCLKKYIPIPFYLNEAYLCYRIKLQNINEEKLMQLAYSHHIAISPIKNHELIISFAALDKTEIEPVILKIKNLIELCY